MTQKTPRPPVTYTFEIAREICERHANGETINAICNRGDAKFPTGMTFMAWVNQHPEVRKIYDEAHEMFADSLVDQTLTIADEAIDAARARNQIAARQWIASKLAREKYGDKVQVDVDHKISIAAILDAAKERISRPMHDLNAPALENKSMKTVENIPIPTDQQSGAVDQVIDLFE